MKRRLLSAFLAVMMVLTMAPVAFAADEDAENTADGSASATLQSKIDAIQGTGEIVLDEDYTAASGYTAVINKGQNITLDLNGHTIKNTAPRASKMSPIFNAGTLTINDSKKSGAIISQNYAGIFVGNGSDTTIKYAKVESVEGAVLTGTSTGAKITIDDGVFNASDNFVVAGNGSPREGNANVITINGGTFTGNIKSAGYIACGIYAPWKDIITVNGGNFTVNNGIGIVARAGQVTVNGGTFTCTGSAKGGVGDKKFDMDAAQCVYFDASNPAYPAYNSATDYIKLQGGTFSSDVSAYAATGYKAVELNGKTVVVVDTADTAVAELSGYKFTNVQNAINAATNNDTVKLLSDVTEDITIADKVITLDMDGKSLKLPSDCGVSVVGASSKLTITGNGVMNCEKTPIAVSEGTVVIENGTITSATDYCTYARDGGTIIVNGGTLTSLNAVLSGNNTTGNMNFIVNGGTLTAKQGPAIYQSGQCELTITGGTLNGGISLRMGQVNISGGTINAATENLDMPGSNVSGTNTPGYAYSGNVWFPDALYVIGGTYTSKDSTYSNSLNLNITGGTFNCTNGQGSAVAIYDLGHTAQAEKITISGDAKFATNCTTRDAYQVVDFEDLRVEPITGYGKTDLVGKVSTAISGGYFTTDPSAYCVTGKTGVSSSDSTYPWTVGTIEVKDENEIKIGTQEGATQATLSSEIAKTDETAATAVGASVTPTKLTDTTPITADDKAQALTELVKNKKVTLNQDGTIPQDTTVTVVKKTYLDVTVTAYDTTSDTVSMDIVPKYDLIAVAKNGNSAAEQIVLKSAQDAKVGSTEVEVTLPNKFKGRKVYINHNNGANLYVATANETTGKVKFTTNGFSPFTFALSNPNVVAEVNGNAYTSFQDAVNAVANGGTIEIVGGNKDYTATISGSSKTIKVKNSLTDANIKVTVNGESKTIKPSEDATFSYTKPSSGGSSGGSSSGKTTYKVTTSAVNNGGVNASPSSAEKGAAITITLSPDKGYKLDKLTVTDGSGKTVSTVKKSDTVYTFTMPASAVKVGVSYVKATETPSETKFNDVSANDWFASAVDYVTGKGMMNGTADNTFSPKANTTRGMVVTVLYRLENQPSTSAASFTDVASGAYYANAVAWANANGIVSGYGSGKFGPNDKVTREQLAAILYRYAQYKKYDVSVGEDTNILSYNDAQSISSYAIPAIQWACGAGVVTGKSGSKLDPKGNATRAEVAAMLMRFCENVK